MSTLHYLRTLDPVQWNTGLSPENARVCWTEAIDALARAQVDIPLSGRAPQKVLIIASANVFTAPLPWLALLSQQGVHIRLKAARGLLPVAQAMATAFPQVEVQDWRGGDTAGLYQALQDVQGVIVFGRAETIQSVQHALQTLGRAVPLLPFGPRFSVGLSQESDAAAAIDLARYDSRGCMSPSAWFTPKPDLSLLAEALTEAQARWPLGAFSELEAATLRSRILLARAVGQLRQGEGWTILHLPSRFFTPISLPRVLNLYSDLPDAFPADRLSTVATDRPSPWAAPRICRPGEMQCPPVGRWHDGYDVLGMLWGDKGQTP